MPKQRLTLSEIKDRLKAIDAAYAEADDCDRQHMVAKAKAEDLESSLESEFPGKFSYIEARGWIAQFGTRWHEPDLPTLEEFYAQKSVELLESGNIFNLYLDGNNLVLRLTDEHMLDRSDIDCTDLHDAAESILCNSEWELLTADLLGGLSEAPCFCDRVDWDEDRTVILDVGRVWAYMDYQICDPFNQLLKHGEVVFTEVID